MHFLGPGSTERQAQAKLAEVTVAVSKGDAVRVSREPFSEFADRWLAEREGELAPTTVDGYHWHLEKLIKPSPHFRKPISKVTHYDIAAFIRDLKGRKSRSGKPLKGWTICGAVSVLSASLSFMMICSGICRRLLCPIAPIVLLAHRWAVRLSQRPDRTQGVTSAAPATVFALPLALSSFSPISASSRSNGVATVEVSHAVLVIPGHHMHAP